MSLVLSMFVNVVDPLRPPHKAIPTYENSKPCLVHVILVMLYYICYTHKKLLVDILPTNKTMKRCFMVGCISVVLPHKL